MSATRQTPPTTPTVLFAPYGINPQGRPYPPHPTQALVRQWVSAVRTGRYPGPGIPTLYLQHGVNAGGTRACLAPLLEYAFEQPGARLLIGRREFIDLRRSVMQTVYDILPAELIVSRNEQLHILSVSARGRGSPPSELHFQHLGDEESLGSQQFAAILVCEAQEITERVFRALQRRARQGALPSFMLLEGNPPTEGHWLIDRLTNPRSDAYDASITVLKLPSSENLAFMTPAYQEMLSSMPAAWRRRYVEAEAGFLPDGTPVYPAFIESVHVRPTALIPDRPILRGWDYGWRRSACLWGQLSDAGQLLLHREWMPMETPESAFIDGVIRRTNDWFGPIACRDIGDPASRNRDPQGISTLRRLSERGIRLLARQSTYAERIPLINQRLSLLIGGEPAIIVDPACRVVIEGLLGGYHYPRIDPERKFTQKHEVPEHDQYYSHLMNCLEYLCVNLFLGATPFVQQARRREQRQWVEQMERTFGTAVF